MTREPHRSASRQIGDLIHSVQCVDAGMPAGKVAEIFGAKPLLDGLAVVDGEKVGALSRARFLGRLHGKFGYALYEKRPVREHVEYDWLTVDVQASPIDVVTAATQRPADRIYDDILVLEGGSFRGLVSMRLLMAHSKELLASSMSQITALEERNENLKEINRLQQEFVANMTHELRTPLNTMLSVARLLLKDTQLSPAWHKDVTVLHRRALDLLAIVNDMLDSYKLEAGEMKPDWENMEIGHVAVDVLDSLDYLASAKGIALETDLSGSSLSFSTDPLFFKRILTNLVSNAIKFTDRGSVSVRVACSPDRLELVVQDTGVGIEEEDIPRLFKKFTQLESAKTKQHGGTGLGLAIVDGLVGLLGGKIEVESRYGAGSTFRVIIPAPEKTSGSAPPRSGA